MDTLNGKKNIMRAPRKHRYNDIIDQSILISHDNLPDAARALRTAFGDRLGTDTDLASALRALDFIAGYRDNGDISAIWYKGEQDDTRDATLNALSPYIHDGGFILWRAAHGRKWRNEFNHGIMTTLVPETIWVQDDGTHENTDDTNEEED